MLVVDDHALFRDGLTALISRWPDFEVIGTAADGAEAVRLAAALHPGLVLMDVRMDGMGGVEATRLITEADPDVTVAMLTMSNLGEDVYQALRNGAHGYLSKDEPADRLHDYLAGLMRGEAAMSSAIAARVLAEFGAPGGSRARCRPRTSGSPTASATCCACWSRACPTRRSPVTCTCPRRR